MTTSPSTRRAFLATAGSAAAATLAGCNGTQYRDRYNPGKRVSLTVSAPPAEDDRAATTIGRRLVDRLTALGVDATFRPTGQSQLYLDALINHDFEVFVGRHPGLDHPDALYPLLHSSFGPESGWQNPFGVASPALDDALESLRAADEHVAALHDVLGAYVERVPFSVVAAPQFITVRRRDLGVDADAVTERPLGVLAYLADADLDRPLRAGIFSSEVTENRNPIAGEFRWNQQLVGLMYDSLARPSRDGTTYLPWAARSWTVEDGELVVDLRPGQRFHDGTPLDATDVAFTFELLSDTSMGNASSPIPATRFRGRTTLVSSVDATDSTTVRVDVAEGVGEDTVERVLTLPILPESEWHDRTGLVDDRAAEASVWENPEPVGSGPLAFESATERESVALTPFADHFLADAADDALARYAPALDGGGLVAQYAPSGEDAVAAIADGRLDTTLHQFPLHAADRVAAEDVVSVTAPSAGLCIVGYNARRAPLSDFRFRQVLARLHDREYVAASTFEGFATETDVPVVDAWRGSAASAGYSVGSFPGADGELDVERGQSLFEDAGFTYDDEGNLYR